MVLKTTFLLCDQFSPGRTPSGSEDDLEYYVRECGEVLGVASRLPPEARSAKHILEYIFSHIVDFKKFNQVSAMCSGVPVLVQPLVSPGTALVTPGTALVTPCCLHKTLLS